MTVSMTTLRLVCELAGVWMVGMAAILAFAVVTIDRLNGRIADLESRIDALGGAAHRPSRNLRRDVPSRALDESLAEQTTLSARG